MRTSQSSKYSDQLSGSFVSTARVVFYPHMHKKSTEHGREQLENINKSLIADSVLVKLVFVSGFEIRKVSTYAAANSAVLPCSVSLDKEFNFPKAVDRNKKFVTATFIKLDVVHWVYGWFFVFEVCVDTDRKTIC